MALTVDVVAPALRVCVLFTYARVSHVDFEGELDEALSSHEQFLFMIGIGQNYELWAIPKRRLHPTLT